MNESWHTRTHTHTRMHQVVRSGLPRDPVPRRALSQHLWPTRHLVRWSREGALVLQHVAVYCGWCAFTTYMWCAFTTYRWCAFTRYTTYTWLSPGAGWCGFTTYMLWSPMVPAAVANTCSHVLVWIFAKRHFYTCVLMHVGLIDICILCTT